MTSFRLTGAALAVLLVADPVTTPASQSASDPAARPSFSAFLDGIRAEAIARGIRPDIVDAALSTVQEPVPVVIERDRTQAETVLSIEKYIAGHVTAKVVKAGRDGAASYRPMLDEVSRRYGVPPGILVAVWGLESNFGRFSGIRPTIAALATLAWDPRRSAFFRGELLSAFEILNHGDIEVSQMRGSWAGAMGQVQFMPSSYLKFAEDFDGDGRRDIWSSPGDVFASIANYLKGKGWADGESWGREVLIPEATAVRIRSSIARRSGTCQATRDMTVILPAEDWRQLGVRSLNGAELPKSLPDAAMVAGTRRHFLVHRNYDALIEYNCAHAYALSVGLLADQVARARSIGAATKRPARAKKATSASRQSGVRKRRPARAPSRRGQV